MTNDGAHNYTWDAEHKMHSVDAIPPTCSTSGECLTYDALGRMVEKTVGSTYTQIVYGPQGRFATMNGQTLASAFIPVPGAQVVYTGGTGGSLSTTNKIAYYRHTDHLGSSRLASTPTQTLYSSTAYAPFGEPYSQSGTTDLSFTGQEQDTVSGIHDFLMRKYPTVQGRWLSPDPAGLAAVDPASPQSWNRYAYVLNNPLALVDPLGLCPGQISGSCGFGQPDLADLTGSAGSGDPVDGGFGLPPGIGGIGGNGIFNGDEVYIPNLPLPNAIWQALGLPSGLSCPVVGGLSSYLCGGLNPIMDVTPTPCLAGAGPLQLGQSRCGDPCSNGTLEAAGVDARQQIAAAQISIAIGRTVFGDSDLVGYFNAVHTGGENDIKDLPGHSRKNQLDVDAGNISYGITCPFGAWFCRFSAGAYQSLGGNPNFSGTLATGFDSPSDTLGIRVGQAMRAAGCHE